MVLQYDVVHYPGHLDFCVSMVVAKINICNFHTDKIPRRSQNKRERNGDVER